MSIWAHPAASYHPPVIPAKAGTCQLASGRYVRGYAIAPVPASPTTAPHQNWLLNKSQSTAKRFSVKWRSSHQAPPSACAIPRMKVSGKSKLSSPHLNSRQIPKIENTLAQKLSTLNSHLSTLPTLSRCSSSSKALSCSPPAFFANASIAARQSNRGIVPPPRSGCFASIAATLQTLPSPQSIGLSPASTSC